MKKLLSLMFAVILCISCSVTSFAQETTFDGSSSDEIMDKVMEYLYEEDGVKKFDVDAAVENGEDEDIISIGESFNTFSSSMVENPRNARLTLEIYGNWCGPGHSGPEAPIDNLDKACKQHDLCYARYQYFDCDCDAELIRTIRYYRDNGYFDKVIDLKVTLAMSYAIEAYFLIAPCTPR